MWGGIKFIIYQIGGVRSGEWNPIKQITSRIESDIKYRKIFSPGGLADIDKNGNISDTEAFEAYKRMGIEGKVNFHGILFPNPTLRQLEKGIDSYNFEK